MRSRIALVVICVTCLVVTSGVPARAKGLMLNRLTVSGPGLERSLELNWQDSFVRRTRSLGSNAAVGGLFRQAIGSEPGFGVLGPRFKLTYHFGGLPGVEMFEGEEFEVYQFLYPHAPDGPYVYTPEQDIGGPRNFAPGFGADWEPFPERFLQRLHRLGLPMHLPEKEISPRQTSQAGPSAVTALGVLLAGLGLVLLRPRLRSLHRFRPAGV